MRMWAAWTAALLQCLLLLQPALADPAMPSLMWYNETNAMLTLRQQLGINESAWPAGEDPCGWWRGVQCLDGHIDTLLLSGLPRLPGTPAMGTMYAFLQLPLLRILNASQVPFPGPIPDWFGSLRSLEAVDLSGCALSGALPASMGNLSRITTLSLANNGLGGIVPPTFGNLSNLNSLNLSANAFVGSIPPLNAPLLSVLDLSHNGFSAGIPSQVSSLRSLQVLNLANNMLNLSVPAELGNLALLNQLDLSNNFLQGPVPPELGRLANLTMVRLSYNNLSGPIPAEITGCRGLRVLELDHNNLTGDIPETVNFLQSLVAMDVSFNGLNGLYPLGLLTLPLLQTLQISNNFFFGPLPQDLTSQQTLQALDLDGNFFNGTVPMGLLPSATTSQNCLAQVEEQRTLRVCTRFYAAMGVAFSFNAAAPSDAAPWSPAVSPAGLPTTIQYDQQQNRMGPLLAGVFGGLALIFFVGAMVFCLHRCQMRRSRERAMDSGRVSAVGEASRWGQPFTYSQLQSATNKFSPQNLIAAGHTGDLYKGETSGGTGIVVKKIDLNKVKRDLYLSELEVFDKASHTKLVSLLGHCLDRDDAKYLVYKHYPNSDLASSLHKKGSPGPCEDVLQSLDWITRLKIAIGVAEGLAYLHSDCTPPIIHRDVRASSILLDDKYEVRVGSLSDVRMQDGDSHSSIISRMFGFSNVSCDHTDPSQAIVSCAYDVYCFGKVLLELVSGKLGISGSNDQQWIEWALPLINVNDKEGLPKIVDPSLIVDEDLIEEVWAMAIIAKACLNSKPSKRPSMKHVLKALENPHKVVREESFGESLAVSTSSHSSWNEALFGSWRHHHNSSVSGHFRGGGVGDDYNPSGMLPISRAPGGLASSSGQNSREMYHLHHTRRGSSDIVPEPIEEVAHETDDGR